VTPTKRNGSSGALLLVGGIILPACELLSTSGLTGGSPPREEDASSVDAIDTVDGSVQPDGRSDAAADDAPGDGRVPCGPDGGGILCGGQCVDPSNDPKNCNGCGNACPTGVCGTSVSASMATAPTSWTFNGVASFNGFAPSAELTPVGNYQAGSVVYDDPIVVDSFSVTFEFRMGLNGGTRSDGIGFMIEQDGATALGGTGAGLGMTGLSGYGVELDIYDNGVCGDSNNDHVGIDDLSICSAKEGTPTSLTTADVTGTVDLADAHFHAAEVSLKKGALSVTIDGNSVVTDVPLPNLKVGGAYYFGFAGGTGGLLAADGGTGGYRQEIRDVVITFPTPRCL